MKNYTKEEFLKEQSPLARLFISAKTNNHLSHAYLINGDYSSPLKESAIFLAKSLNCKESALSCSSCNNCKKFDEGIHPDFIYIDGTLQTIKKDSINDLSSFFALSAFEKNHLGSYVINHVENMTNEAINALLKFLEEPQGNIIAFLTTSNITKVLPTIISRCEVVDLRPIDYKYKLDNYMGNVSLDRYYILSHLAYSDDDIEELDNSKEFDDAYNCASEYLEALTLQSKKASFILFSKAGEKLKSSKCYNYFYSILIIVFYDALKEYSFSPLNEFVIALRKKKDKLTRAIDLLNEAQASLKANINFNFVLAKLALVMEDR